MDSRCMSRVGQGVAVGGALGASIGAPCPIRFSMGQCPSSNHVSDSASMQSSCSKPKPAGDWGTRPQQHPHMQPAVRAIKSAARAAWANIAGALLAALRDEHMESKRLP